MLLSRRKLLFAGAGAAPLTWLSGWPRATAAPRTGRTRAPSPAIDTAYAFLGPAEVAFVDAAVARLIPTDVLGPGAAEAGVTVFIDRQLAGRFGHALDWYMAGPWADGTEQQGYQSHRTPAALYRAAIAAIDAHCRRSFHDRVFADLGADDRDALLGELEHGRVELQGVSAKLFFGMLWHNTQEGYFADPLYEGNRGFAGWKLVGFPGPRYNYIDDIRHYGQPYPLPTVGLMGRDPTRRPSMIPA